MICPKCGEIFKEAGHKIIIHTCTAQQSVPTIEEAAEKEDAATQEPASLTTRAEVATNSVIGELKDEIMYDDGDRDGTVTPECSHDIEIIEAEPQRQDIDELEQGAVTQEPASLSILVQLAEKMGEEPGMEDTLELNEELYTVTPECSQDTELIGEELQQQEDEGVSQDVATQEPTSLGVAAGILELQ